MSDAKEPAMEETSARTPPAGEGAPEGGTRARTSRASGPSDLSPPAEASSTEPSAVPESAPKVRRRKGLRPGGRWPTLRTDDRAAGPPPSVIPRSAGSSASNGGADAGEAPTVSEESVVGQDAQEQGSATDSPIELSPAIVLDEIAVARVLAMEDLIPLLEHTLAEFSSGRALQPVRHALALGRHASFLGVMPAWLRETDALAVKVVSVAPRNAARGLPTHLATVLLLDPSTGALLAVMDGRLITEMRTAAVSAISAKHLAREGPHTLTILGSGVQARSHLEALRLVRPLSRVRVWSPTPEHRERFAAEESRRWDLPVEPVAAAEDAVRGASLIVTATAATAPVLRGAWLDRGVHVMAVGSSRPGARELDAEAVQRARVFVDSRDAAAVEAGDLLLAQREGAIGPDHVVGELGAVLAGTLEGRENEHDITIFKSLGMAVEDAAAARHVYDRARGEGLGTVLHPLPPAWLRAASVGRAGRRGG